MERLIINPEDYQNNYIQHLNECFSGWGGENEYNWFFNRTVGRHSSDLLIIENNEDGVIAGSGVSYRRLRSPNEGMDIGIMTGSWTLPAARRKGCFTKMINCSKDLCRKKNVPLLTAFVTETNASCRRLESAGSYMFPTYHLFSSEVPFQDIDHNSLKNREKSEQLTKEVYQRMLKTQNEYLNFEYNLEEFEEQYINRIKDTMIFQINEDFIILEDGVNEVKILLVTYPDEETFSFYLKMVTNWCLNNKSLKAFYFTTRKALSQICMTLGFQCAPGYFTVLNAEGKNSYPTEIFADLNINMADKM